MEEKISIVFQSLKPSLKRYMMDKQFKTLKELMDFVLWMEKK
jgi:hypothetical protein